MSHVNHTETTHDWSLEQTKEYPEACTVQRQLDALDQDVIAGYGRWNKVNEVGPLKRRPTALELYMAYAEVPGHDFSPSQLEVLHETNAQLDVYVGKAQAPTRDGIAAMALRELLTLDLEQDTPTVLHTATVVNLRVVT